VWESPGGSARGSPLSSYSTDSCIPLLRLAPPCHYTAANTVPLLLLPLLLLPLLLLPLLLLSLDADLASELDPLNVQHPSRSRQLPLERCMRILPHHQAGCGKEMKHSCLQAEASRSVMVADRSVSHLCRVALQHRPVLLSRRVLPFKT